MNASKWMYVTAGVITKAIGKVAVMIRGTPLVTHDTWVSLPWPPVAWSLMLASSTAWNSGVSGAAWGNPKGLVWSHWVPTPRGRFHCPPQSGYLDSSKATAGAVVIARAAISAKKASGLRSSMFPPRSERCSPDGATGPGQGRTRWLHPHYASTGRHLFKSTTIHRSRPEAEGFASIRTVLRGTGRPLRFASAARVAREDTELLEPFFQRKCMLARRLGIPADRKGLASIRQIGRTRRLARRRCRSAF